MSELYTHGTSNCCGAPVYDDSDICSACKEHCAVCVECETCEGTGIKATRENTGLPPFGKSIIKQTCPDCEGVGWIE